MKNQNTALHFYETQEKSNSYNKFKYKRIIRLILLLLFFLTHLSFLQSQPLISEDGADHPQGYNDPDEPDYIVLPAAEPGVEYIFVVNLLDIVDSHNAEVDFTPCSDGTDITTVFNAGSPPTLTVTIPADWICNPDPTVEQRHIDIRIDVENTGTGDSDDQFFRIPIARDPVKIAMVLDISGSMSLPTPGDDIDFTPRWEVLKLAVISFIDKLEALRQSEDSLALTYFTTGVIQPAFTTSDDFISITNPIEDPPVQTSSEIVSIDMAGRGPLNMTAMGLGLLDGKAKLGGNDPDPDGAKKIVLLFTDGLQNIPPLVDNVDGQNLSDGQKLNECDPSCSPADSIKYYTISIGAGPLVPEVLQSIADNNSGIALQSTVGDEFDFYEFFNNQWTNMLYSGSPQIINSEVSMLVSGGAQHAYKINRNIDCLLFELISDDCDSIELIVQKNGIKVDPTIYQHDSHHTLLGFNLPVEVEQSNLYSEGEWEVLLSGTSSRNYFLTCFADDHLFDYSCELDKSIYTVEDPINLSVKLSYAGEILSGNATTVDAIVFKPGDDLGHLLSTYETPGGDNDEDVVDPAQQKFQDLLSSDTSFFHALLPDDQIIELQTTGDGLYQGVYTGTELTGVYKIVFKINGQIESVGDIERTKVLNTVFKFGQVEEEEPEVVDNPTPPSTGSNKGLTALKIRPKNKFGYYMGPGYKSKIKFGLKVRSARAQKTSLGFPENGETDISPTLLEIMDNLDGSYLLYLENLKGNPAIEITVREETQYSGKVWPFPNWFFVLGIILFLCIIIIGFFSSPNKKVLSGIFWILILIWLIFYVLHSYGIVIIF